MAEFEQKPGTGILFKNEKKTEDKHPSYRGKIKDPTGKEWEISLWVKEGSKGKFFSASIKEPYVKDVPAQTQPNNQEESDLPF